MPSASRSWPCAFPVVILSIPLAVTFISLGIFDKVYSLALMHTALTLPTTILVIGSVFASIPYELEEAAQVFGCTPVQAFRRVVLPLVLPGIAAAAVFTFVMSWNEVFAATVLTVQNRRCPPRCWSRCSYRGSLTGSPAGSSCWCPR